jgi:RNA ligase
MKFNLEVLDKYIQEGLINKQKHPRKNIWIYNYTPECVFSKKWDDITIQCRGLILDEEGNVIGRPFKKFWNYDEPEVVIPNGTPKIFKKMDGSLIIVIKYDGEVIVATRGSFVSDQAKMANELLLKNNFLFGIINSVDNEFTYLFELIGKDNRIVVAYPENELILLAVVTNCSGVEHNLHYYGDYTSIKVVEEYAAEWNENTIKTLQELNIQNEEGFVLKWDNGYRVKIKFADYFRLHKLITGLNEKAIWEFMQEHDNIDELVKQVPEEFENFVRTVYTNIDEDFWNISERCIKFIKDNKLKELTRKESAEIIMKILPQYQGVLFSLLDDKNEQARKNIWKLVKPKTNKYFKEVIKEEL